MNDIQRTDDGNVAERLDTMQEGDFLNGAKRVFDYLDEHPGVGVIAGGGVTASGIAAIAYYGRKLILSKPLNCNGGTV